MDRILLPCRYKSIAPTTYDYVLRDRGEVPWRPLTPSAYRLGPQRGDLRLALVAQRYVELLKTSSTPKPDLVREQGPGTSTNTVNSWLHTARKRGLLTSVGRGRAVGELTAEALRLIEGNRS